MTEEKELKNTGKQAEIRILDSKIEEVASKISKKTGINIEKAETELRMGIIMSMMMNRHRVQELKEK